MARFASKVGRRLGMRVVARVVSHETSEVRIACACDATQGSSWPARCRSPSQRLGAAAPVDRGSRRGDGIRAAAERTRSGGSQGAPVVPDALAVREARLFT